MSYARIDTNKISKLSIISPCISLIIDLDQTNYNFRNFFTRRYENWIVRKNLYPDYSVACSYTPDIYQKFMLGFIFETNANEFLHVSAWEISFNPQNYQGVGLMRENRLIQLKANSPTPESWRTLRVMRATRTPAYLAQ